MSERILVCGSRNWSDRDYLEGVLDRALESYGIDVVIHGAARGADTMAGEWASKRGIPVMAFPADWAAHGRAAGPIRNQRMLTEGMPTLVLAFHDDIEASKGTRDMVRRAKQANVRAIVLRHGDHDGSRQWQ